MKYDLTPNEARKIEALRQQDNVIDNIVKETIKEVSEQEANTLDGRVTRLESGQKKILEVAKDLEQYHKEHNVRIEQEQKNSNARSKENLQILKEVHNLRVEVSHLTPKISIYSKGFYVIGGAVLAMLVPKIVPFLEKIYELWV